MNDVRLTMGGEPTFISIDDPDGPEWNFTAVSHKEAHSLRRTHQAAAQKIRARLAAALRPGQMVSGRGTSALGARLLLAQGRRADLERRRPHRGRIEELRLHSAKDAKELLSRIAHVAGADPKYLLPAYEDAFLLHVEGAASSVQRHAGEIQFEKQAGARSHCAPFPTRSG